MEMFSRTGSRYRLTTIWAMRSDDRRIPNGLVPRPLLSVYRPDEQVAENSCPKTSDSRSEKVVLQILFKLCNGLPIYSSRSLVRLYSLVCLPYLPFGNTKRPCFIHEVLPSRVANIIKPDNAAPSVQFHYRTFFPTTGCSAPVSRIGTLALVGPPLEFLP